MGNNIKCLSVTRGDFSINIYSNQNDILNNITSGVKPYYNSEYVSSESYHSGWSIYFDEKDMPVFNGLSRPKYDLAKPVNEPERVYAYYLAEKIIVIEEPNDVEWKLQHALRLIRVLSRIHFFNKGMLFFHGGYINYKNHGVALLGSKYAGKTTTILTSLSNGNANFITNDDIGLCSMDNSVLGFGWPRAISIREDTKKLKHLECFFNDFSGSHPANKIGSDSFYTFFYPQELAKVFNCEVESGHPLHIVLFLSFYNDAKETKVRKLDYTEALRYLKENYQSDFNKYSDFLSECIKVDEEKNMRAIEEMSESIMFFELQQNFHNTAMFNTALDKIVTELKYEY